MHSGAKDEQFKASSIWELERMKIMDAYIAIRGSNNVLRIQMFPQRIWVHGNENIEALVLDWLAKDKVVY